MVLIGVGSNRGDTVATVIEAMRRLAAFASGPVRRSSLWRTSPVDCPPGSPDFINAAAAFEPRPGLTPEALLRGLKTLEAEYGREIQPVRNAPRELDLDLLVFGTETRDEPDFVLPHPRAVNRLFVLAPAEEVAPGLIWPGTGRTVAQLRRDLNSSERIDRLSLAEQS
ncbi:MAG: 2-amino-4-hydroxy-6-hydroxymethyldihydropteridine diphosphokinase [Pseudomonadales bacterium]